MADIKDIIHLTSDPKGNSQFCFPESPDLFSAADSDSVLLWILGR